MFKGLVTAGSYTSGNIPITQYKNTNNIFSLSDNQIYVKQDGIVDMKANIIVTASSAGDLTAQLYGNGVAIQGATFTVTAVSASDYTLTLNDVVLIANQSSQGYANLSVQISSACTIVGGDVICEYRA